MTIAYFVQDLSDPAVSRRIVMMRRGGAEVLVAGFYRGETAPDELAGADVIALGRTFDGRLGHRILATVRALGRVGELAVRARDARVIVARNLETLLVASAVRLLGRLRAGLVYEVLDVHRVMLSRDAKGMVMRELERRLMRGVRGLVISSPAFDREYFTKIQHAAAERILMENRAAEDLRAPSAPPPPPPWRIGWFGNLRCQKSLDILDALSRRLPGAVEVHIRGRPSYNVFRDFDAQVAANPALRFGGRYRPEELGGLYGACHFVWGVDYYEESLNSDWLLPNRLYEGGACERPVIALKDVETGRWLAGHGAGVLVGDPLEDLSQMLRALTPLGYEAFQRAARDIPRSALVYTAADCRAFVEAIGA